MILDFMFIKTIPDDGKSVWKTNTILNICLQIFDIDYFLFDKLVKPKHYSHFSLCEQHFFNF